MTYTVSARPGGALAVQLEGRLTLGPRLLEFGRKLGGQLVAQRPAGVLLDVSRVVEIDSAGLGELVILSTTAAEVGGRFCLLTPSERLVRLLESTHLMGILQHFDTEADALTWLSRSH